MRIYLDSTDKIVELVTPTGRVPARVWEGHTESGVACHALITRIGVAKDLDTTVFEQELQSHRAPSPEVNQAYDLRMVL